MAAATHSQESSSAPASAEIVEQTKAISLLSKCIELGLACALLGAAGTGKTSVIRRLVTERTASGDGDLFLLTALTGLAARNLDPTLGQTFHSTFAIRDGRESPDAWLAALNARPSALREIQGCSACVIDEISMMDATLFEKFDFVMRHVRDEPARPFGGMCVIFLGDFHQLPPIREGVSLSFPSRTTHALVVMSTAQGKALSGASLFSSQPSFATLFPFATSCFTPSGMRATSRTMHFAGA